MKDPITQAARKIVADEAGAALHEIACGLSTLAGEVDELTRTAKARIGQAHNYRERIKDAIRDYAERHAHCQEQNGRRRWKKKHCAPAGGKRKRKGGNR